MPIVRVLGVVLALLALAVPLRAQDGGELPSIGLDVAEVQVIPAYAPTGEQGVEQTMSPTPQDAFVEWARNGIRPLGPRNRAMVTVHDASIVRVALKPRTGISGWFSRDPAARYDGVISIELGIRDEFGTLIGSVEAQATYQRSVLEDPSPEEVNAALREVRRELVSRVVRALRGELDAHLAQFLR